jgi:hypothetical protein
MFPRAFATFSLLVACAAARAAQPAQAVRITRAGTERVGGAVRLQKAGGSFRAAGLWSERRDFPGQTAIKGVRVLEPTVPARCGLISQARWATGAEVWSTWTPANLLRKGARKLGVAVADETGAGDLWQTAAAPGSGLTFAATVAPRPAARQAGVGMRLSDGAGTSVAEVRLRVRAGAASDAARRTAVGIVAPAWTRTILCRGVAEDRLRARDGMLTFAEAEPGGQPVLVEDFARAEAWETGHGTARWGKDADAELALTASQEAPLVPAVRKEGVNFAHKGWLEVRATVTLSDATAVVSVMLHDADGAGLGRSFQLRCSGRGGRYRIWGRGPVPAEVAKLRLVVVAGHGRGPRSTVIFHRIELRATGPPPAFVPHPPAGEIPLPAGVQTRRLEVRSFLLSADPAATPSLKGYAVKTE